jgi:hypothetical protein
MALNVDSPRSSMAAAVPGFCISGQIEPVMRSAIGYLLRSPVDQRQIDGFRIE